MSSVENPVQPLEACVSSVSEHAETSRQSTPWPVEREMKCDKDGGTLTVAKEGMIGERVFEFCIWGWKVQITPTLNWPFEWPSKVVYMPPDHDLWLDFLKPIHVNCPGVAGLRGLAKSVIARQME